jgi:hypothetical protein
VTLSPTEDPRLAVEIPRDVKQRLGLDEARSWVMLSWWNDFVWPGPDLRPLPGGDGSLANRLLPAGLFASIRDRRLALVQSRASTRVPRA